MIQKLPLLLARLPGVDEAFYDYESAAAFIRIKQHRMWINTDDMTPPGKDKRHFIRLTVDGKRMAVINMIDHTVQFYVLEKPWQFFTATYCYTVNTSDAKMIDYSFSTANNGCSITDAFMRFIGAA